MVRCYCVTVSGFSVKKDHCQCECETLSVSVWVCVYERVSYTEDDLNRIL